MITIRPPVQTDRAAWEQLWTGYLEYYETSVAPEVYETAFTRLLGNDPNDFHGAIALKGETPVGLVHYLFHRHL